MTIDTQDLREALEAATKQPQKSEVVTRSETTIKHQVDIDGLLGFAIIMGLAMIGASDPALFWSMW